MGLVLGFCLLGCLVEVFFPEYLFTAWRIMPYYLEVLVSCPFLKILGSLLFISVRLADQVMNFHDGSCVFCFLLSRNVVHTNADLLTEAVLLSALISEKML